MIYIPGCLTQILSKTTSFTKPEGVHESMVILSIATHSKLLILHFLYYENFVACYSQRRSINHGKSVKNINI
jgi:hypothetical protein